MNLTFFQATDRGRVRENNEDYFAACGPFTREPESKGALFALADGLGGLEAGEVASREAVERLIEIFKGLGPQPFKDWLTEAFQAVHAHVRRLNKTRPSPMATTLTACYFHEGQIQIAHVGDCRVYCSRGGRVHVLTRDHLDRQRALTRVIGIDPVLNVDYLTLPATAGDVYLNASDGLYAEILEREMHEALSLDTPEAACRQLIRTALDHGGYDNTTAQVIRLMP